MTRFRYLMRRARHAAGCCHRYWRRYVATAVGTGSTADGAVVGVEMLGLCPKHLDELVAECEVAA